MKSAQTTNTKFVSEAAMMKRLRRALRKEGTRLVRAPINERAVYGEYLAVDVSTNFITGGCDPEAWAREMGVLKPHEHLAPEAR